MNTLYKIANSIRRAYWFIFRPHNEVIVVDTDFFQFGYDYSILHDKNYVVLEVVFVLTPKPIEEITADELAERVGTINYEVVARISPLLKRIIV